MSTTATPTGFTMLVFSASARVTRAASGAPIAAALSAWKPHRIRPDVALEVLAWAKQTRRTDGTLVIDHDWVKVSLARVHATAEALNGLLNVQATNAAPSASRGSSASRSFQREGR